MLFGVSACVNVAAAVWHFGGQAKAHTECVSVSRMTPSDVTHGLASFGYRMSGGVVIPLPVTSVMPSHAAATKNPKPLAVVEPRLASAADFMGCQLNSLGATVLLQNGNSSDNPPESWHASFVDDTSDPIWSPMAEGQTRAFLNGALDSGVSLLGVKCSSRGCEVQAISTSADDAERAANSWQETMSGMSGQSWWAGYGLATPESAIWKAEDGRVLLVSYSSRVNENP